MSEAGFIAGTVAEPAADATQYARAVWKRRIWRSLDQCEDGGPKKRDVERRFGKPWTELEAIAAGFGRKPKKAGGGRG